MKFPPELWASVIFVGQMADAFSTRILIERGGIIGERNPIIHYILGQFGLIGLDILKSSVGAAFVIVGFLVASETIWIAMSIISWIPAWWNLIFWSRS